jgi:DcuC family C4-dicarboxylate transporter
MVVIAAGAPPLGGLTLLPAALIIAAAVLGIARGWDVRLVLFAAALALGALAGDPAPVVRKFFDTFSDEQFVVPICSAMGFAYALRHTGCDRHLVRLLTRPLRRVRPLLVPGVVLVGFLVNIPVISQTSTAVCLGAVVVPLMRAAGVSPLTTGACILLGASIGGELLNPGAPELNTVAKRLSTPENPVGPQAVVPAVSRLIFFHLALATALFWWLSARAERRGGSAWPTDEDEVKEEEFRVNYLRALVPVVPLVLLFLTGPPLNLVRVPEAWLVEAKSRAAYGTRLIGLAMLIGVLAAALASPAKAGAVPRAFFEGAGYAFATIVSIIVTASCFGTAVVQVGLAAELEKMVRAAPGLLVPLAGSIPLAFAALSGSGMAATQSLYALFVPSAEALGLDRLDLGAVVATGAAAGRTMSPVAAVTLMCASMTSSSPFALAKRVALPLLASWSAVVAIRLLGWI